MLDSVVAVIADRLSQIPGIDAVLAEYPPNLAHTRTLILFASPGAASPLQHRGRNGGIVFQANDSVMVDFIHKIQVDRYGQAEAAARTMLDAVRLALLDILTSPAMRQEVIQINQIETQLYGDLIVGSDEGFGFRLAVDIIHAYEGSGA